MREYEPIPEQDEALAKKIIGAAIEVHRELGPGFWRAFTARLWPMSCLLKVSRLKKRRKSSSHTKTFKFLVNNWIYVWEAESSLS